MSYLKKFGHYIAVGVMALLGLLFITKGRGKQKPEEEDVLSKELVEEKDSIIHDNKKVLLDANEHIGHAKDAVDSVDGKIAKIKAKSDNKLELKVDDWNG